MVRQGAVLLFVVVAIGCNSTPPAPAPAATSASAPAASERVDGATAHALVAKGARLIDVRSPEEYAEKHIDGAESFPVDAIDTRDLGPKDRPLVLYCHSGRRSARAAASLRARGYTRVHDLGAMSSWDDAR